MRLFLIQWADYVPELADVALELKSDGHEILYWTRSAANYNLDESKFPGTIFHSYEDALSLKPATIFSEFDFSPPGESLLQKMSSYESIVLTMMNKKYEWLGVNERKQIYYRLLRYWNGVIDKLLPECIIFPVVPHTVYDYVIYALAKEKNIKTIMLDMCRVNDDRLVIINDFVLGCEELKKSLQNDSNVYVENNLEPDVLKYYLSQVNATPTEDRTPLDVQDLLRTFAGFNKLKLSLKIIFKGIIDLSIFTKAYLFFKNRLGSNLRVEYNRLVKQPDLSVPFVYVPLNYQPERTTSPTGGVFVDQLLMVQTLSNALPAGWKIYVKEHPFQWSPRGVGYFSYRYKGYYEAMASLPNVELIPLKTSNYILVEKTKAVATVTGTAGWEALFRGRPALIFGYPWYQHCKGVFKVGDTESVKTAFKKINDNFVVSKSDLIKYLYFFQKFSFRGYLDIYGEQIASISRLENKNNFLTALRQAIKQ